MRYQLFVVLASLSCRVPEAMPHKSGVPPLEDAAREADDNAPPKPVATTAPAPSPVPGPADGSVAADSLAASEDIAARETPAASTPPTPPQIPTVGCKGVRVCDDFEAYPVGARPGGTWTVSGSSSLLVDSTRSFSGSKSILIKVPAAANAQVFMSPGKTLFPLPDNIMRGRMMVFLPKSPGPGDRHWDMVIASGPLPTGGRGNYMFGGYTERFWPSYQPHHCWKDSKSPFTFGKWFCMQWHFDGSPATGDTRKNQMRFSIDGVPHPDISVDNFGSGCTSGKWPWVAPSFDSIRLGWIQYQVPTAPVEVWIDDVAVSDAPIACPAPKP